MKLTTFLLASMMFFLSCQRTNENKNKDAEQQKNWSDLIAKTVNYWSGRKMILPSNLPIVNRDSTSFQFEDTYKAPLRMVAFIDGTCGVCVSNLKHWHNFINEVKKLRSNCDFIFYIEADNKDEFQKNIMSQLDITWVFDKDRKFIHLNKLNERQFQTALLKKNNEVIMIGTIVSSPEIESLYKEMIFKYGK